MARRQLLAAACVALLGLTGAMLEASFVHTDDGCVVETHCKTCLLQLRTPVVVTATFSLPMLVVAVESVAPAPPPACPDAAPKDVSSRGPPRA
jgi:hypothetical protein